MLQLVKVSSQASLFTVVRYEASQFKQEFYYNQNFILSNFLSGNRSKSFDFCFKNLVVNSMGWLRGGLDIIRHVGVLSFSNDKDVVRFYKLYRDFIGSLQNGIRTKKSDVYLECLEMISEKWF